MVKCKCCGVDKEGLINAIDNMQRLTRDEMDKRHKLMIHNLKVLAEL